MKQTTLYTALKRLEKQGHLTSWEREGPSGKARTYYSITPEGTALLAAKREEWSRVAALIDHFIRKGTSHEHHS